MPSLSGKHISYWIDSTPTANFPPLSNNLTVDVAIVGAGIAGITAATLLKRAGKTVAIIESRQISTGVSGHTTAKITSLHQLIYADLIKNHCEEKAHIYAKSNQAALEFVAKTVREEQIDCDFSRQSAYTFAETEENLKDIEKEVEAALKIGLPATFVRETSLPFPIAGAVKFDNQAQFHSRKYLLHLIKQIPGNGSYVFENTRVEKVEENNLCQVITNKGIIQAQDVIVATNIPITDEGLFFAKTYPKRSYIIGARIAEDKAPQGMYIGSGEKYYSIRTTPVNGGLLLLVGGGGHKVGTVENTEEKYLDLENYARSRFGVESIDYRWSTQDFVSFDKIPYVGKLTPLSKHTFVATGFSLWGMTQGTLSGMILADNILGIENPAADLYDATRATPFVSPQGIKQNLEVGAHWVGDRLKGLNKSLSDVAIGEGKLVTVDGEKVAAYRDEKGEIHAVSAVCSHLGCVVAWNSAEKSWDCPCHGSRFSCNGEVLHGPTVKDLTKL
ncbi:FAD-dependent oxidoreductase [Anabaena sphaerica FACHB-251]|uniref:FAD-dependent oxidoreductase n=1 Tax=Anabaena sphaerica FACHB-251 TaxID=2692883 RepID=A0A927A2C9_9NOST|nr:FAD-dependent oxidoreductase [Anabaena sphaerica]MBD2295624.1 FAD-dependent oxidoreductase [Anabaena sphaerica FACHB-251]